MVIDGCMMVTTARQLPLSRDDVAHRRCSRIARAKRVVIIGGGDCGTLREVLKHDEVEKRDPGRDRRARHAPAERYFPSCASPNSDPRAQLLFIDGIKWMAECEPDSLDVVIVDSTDPIGPAEGLFNEAFYRPV
jgi:spermidine synthase